MLTVSPISQNTNPNFRAIKVAETYNTVRDITTKIDLYKIQPQDWPFLMRLQKLVDYKNLCTKFSKDLVARWQRIFNYCIDGALYNERVSYVAVSEGKVCGIMTYSGGSTMLWDGVCSIPIRENQKVPLVGTTLFYMAFRDAKAADVNKIDLKAVVDGPYDVASKYEKFGFKHMYTGDGQYDEMSCGRHNIKDQLHRLKHKIVYMECDERSEE